MVNVPGRPSGSGGNPSMWCMPGRCGFGGMFSATCTCHGTAEERTIFSVVGPAHAARMGLE